MDKKDIIETLEKVGYRFLDGSYGTYAFHTNAYNKESWNLHTVIFYFDETCDFLKLYDYRVNIDEKIMLNDFGINMLITSVNKVIEYLRNIDNKNMVREYSEEANDIEIDKLKEMSLKLSSI